MPEKYSDMWLFSIISVIKFIFVSITSMNLTLGGHWSIGPVSFRVPLLEIIFKARLRISSSTDSLAAGVQLSQSCLQAYVCGKAEYSQVIRPTAEQCRKKKVVKIYGLWKYGSKRHATGVTGEWSGNAPSIARSAEDSTENSCCSPERHIDSQSVLNMYISSDKMSTERIFSFKKMPLRSLQNSVFPPG